MWLCRLQPASIAPSQSGVAGLTACCDAVRQQQLLYEVYLRVSKPAGSKEAGQLKDIPEPAQLLGMSIRRDSNVAKPVQIALEEVA